MRKTKTQQEINREECRKLTTKELTQALGRISTARQMLDQAYIHMDTQEARELGKDTREQVLALERVEREVQIILNRHKSPATK